MSYKNVRNFRHNRKKLLVDCLGGQCAKCGYDLCLQALDFHHLDPNEKDFTISQKIESLDRCVQEIQKCVCLCCRCHQELHYDLWSLTDITIPECNLAIIDQWLKRHIKTRMCKSETCTNTFETTKNNRYFCSDTCRSRHNGQIRLRRRKVKRPSARQLRAEIETYTWVALGEKYGVSDNAVRKWAKAYGII
jgi:hypothetical protein